MLETEARSEEAAQADTHTDMASTPPSPEVLGTSSGMWQSFRAQGGGTGQAFKMCAGAEQEVCGMVHTCVHAVLGRGARARAQRGQASKAHGSIRKPQRTPGLIGTHASPLVPLVGGPVDTHKAHG